ncbi:LacI family DNA-binding transcriptional regulator [Nocardioides sp. NPDC127503]|uniref:LacI family DNA-binding transcriptional regulator n=1 Tax=Nocardioides sp. NPDC127503 TaxID=3154516 RepID=UPI00332795D8
MKYSDRSNEVEPLRRATIDDVAKLAKVHKATVSRALNERKKHQVSPATIDKVERAARQVGYAPNALARGLRTNSSMTIGVVLPDITNPFFPPMVRGIENVVSPRGYTSLLVNTDGDKAMERTALSHLIDRRVDGLIVASGQRDETVLSELHKAGTKVVLLNRDAGAVPYPLVRGDDGAGIDLAVEHLVGLGHRHILHLAGPANFSTTSKRADAFAAACLRHPELDATVERVESLTARAGEEGMNVVLGRGTPPTAVLAGNDLIALGALRALRARGLRCPADVSIVGFNDMPFAEDFSPPLTTVRVPTELMGRRAAQLILEWIDGGSLDQQTVVLPVSLVDRESTAPPRS